MIPRRGVDEIHELDVDLDRFMCTRHTSMYCNAPHSEPGPELCYESEGPMGLRSVSLDLNFVTNPRDPGGSAQVVSSTLLSFTFDDTLDDIVV
jgi:hypothetical protein